MDTHVLTGTRSSVVSSMVLGEGFLTRCLREPLVIAQGELTVTKQSGRELCYELSMHFVRATVKYRTWRVLNMYVVKQFSW